jgi:serine/threonine protein kinase
MEFVPGGDLGSLIYRRGHLPEADVNVMASQLLSALQYLHEMGITHRDVKPDNILIHNSNPFHVKLTDFGLSKMVDSEETFLRTFCGTLLYCAPEVYSEYREYDDAGRRNPRGVSKKALPPQRYDDAVDIWSLAGVLFYALCGSPPYPVKNGTTYQELLNHIMTQPLDIRPLQQVGVSESAIRFVRSMLHTRPENRATIDELENSSWLGGPDSIEMSIEDDEVDMIGDGIDPQLQNGASQLSIHDEDFRQIDDSQDLQSVSDLTEIHPPEIPSSFNSEDNSNGSFSFPSIPVNPGNGRLFGEVVALGSSGAIGNLEHLPIPVNHNALSAPGFSQDARLTQSDQPNDSPQIEDGMQHPSFAAVTKAMPPPPPPTNEKAIHANEADERATRSSSLMGTESLVGHLNMHSSASATSPSANAPTPPTTTVHDTTVSLRRPREEEEEEMNDQPWRPSDLPPKKRRRSEREIDAILPPSVFWDPKDRSTHHNNYPTMSISDLKHYETYAAAKGELFQHGQKTFDTTMQSFRSSRSPSLEPDTTRAHSEPIKDSGRRVMMKRDERTLGEDLVERIKAIEPQRMNDRDYYIPATARASDEPPDVTVENDSSSTDVANFALLPVVGNDFQPPKRILAKVLATPDSCLPTLSLNITEDLTSWGRGFKNTVRLANGQETRFPKYALKILLFKQGAYDANIQSNLHDQDMTFYISSKAAFGIKLNGVTLPSADSKEPLTPSKFWVELHSGDILTLWSSDVQRICTKFRFECYLGRSQEPRKEGVPWQFIPHGELLNEIEHACSTREKIMLAKNEEREEQDRKMREQEKQARRGEEAKRVDVNQSFTGRSASVN